MGEASMYDWIFLILLFYMYVCILYVDILSNKSIYLFRLYIKGHGIHKSSTEIKRLHNVHLYLKKRKNICAF
jgi:hypothetical protein